VGLPRLEGGTLRTRLIVQLGTVTPSLVLWPPRNYHRWMAETLEDQHRCRVATFAESLYLHFSFASIPPLPRGWAMSVE
jgi:hypothetical protein